MQYKFPYSGPVKICSQPASQPANNLTHTVTSTQSPGWASHSEFHTFCPHFIHINLSQSLHKTSIIYKVHLDLHDLIRIQLNTDTEIIITADNWITYALIFRVHIWDLTGMIVLQMRISLHSPSLHSGFLVHSPHKAAFVSYMNATMDPERD